MISALVGLGGGCTRPNESHCGNKEGDATCAARDPARPHCDRCEAINDGCVAQPVTEPGCGEQDEGAGSDEGSDATTEVATAESTGSLCGNGAIDPGEACDGAALPEGSDCLSEGLGEGVPGCAGDCSALDYSVCPPFVGCGDGVVSNGEQCDGTNLAGQTCGQFPGYQGAGLACTDDCMLDMSMCGTCVLTGGSCRSGQDVCCTTGDTCSIVMMICCQGPGCL
ncbi:MAG: hypothetical protein KDK70_17440 [Myxococcales bacterium]|nr:hypothetical protein [Myxococcales bacterium]